MEMTSVGSFASRPHAEMAASMLSAHGISADVVGDDAGGAAAHFNLGSGGGYTIHVAPRDREAAEGLLDGDVSLPDGGAATGTGATGRAAVGRVLVALALVALLGGLVWSAAI